MFLVLAHCRAGGSPLLVGFAMQFWFFCSLPGGGLKQGIEVKRTSLKRVVSRQFFTLLFYYMRAGQICEIEPQEL